MKLKIDSTDLKKVLSKIERITSGAKTIEALASVLVKVSDKEATFTAFDLQNGIIETVNPIESQPGTALIPVKPLFSFLKNCSDSVIEIETTDETTTRIKCGNYSCNLTCCKPSDFVVIPLDIEKFEAGKIKIAASTLTHLFDFTYAAYKDTTRPVFSGLSLKSKDNLLCVASTDGRRLAYSQAVYNGNLSLPQDGIIIPKTWVDNAQKILTDAESDEVFLCVYQDVVAIKVGDTILFGSLLLGEFPGYEEIIKDAKASSVGIKVNREDFVRSMKIASSISSDKAVILKAKENKTIDIQFTTQNVQGAGFFDFSESKNAEKFYTGCNPFYLIEALNHIKEEAVWIFQEDKSSPLLLLGEGNEDIHIVMPINIQ